MSNELVITKTKAELIIKKDYVNVLRHNEPKFGVLFTDFIVATVTKKSKRMSSRYMLGYRTLVWHLNEFQALYGVILYTNSITEEFLDDFIIYLEEVKNERRNYVSNLITLIKGMARKAGVYGYAVDPSYDDVEVPIEESFSTYLSLNEITRIYYFKGLTRKEERIRDLFIVGCLVAMRYSDYSTLRKSNFSDGYITKITQKTGQKVIVPMHDYVKEIIAKYDGNIEFGLCSQHFNRYVKTICKKVGLNEEISYQYTKGGKLISETKQKWELISSHTARRSAATGMVLSGYKFYEVMAITGHTTEKSFVKYVKVTHEDIAKSMAGGRYFNK